jgi:hypothetical protein
MEALSWILVVAVVYCCSIDFDSLTDWIRRHFQFISSKNPSLARWTSTHGSNIQLDLTGSDVVRGYDTPELLYHDTIARVRILPTVRVPL